MCIRYEISNYSTAHTFGYITTSATTEKSVHTRFHQRKIAYTLDYSSGGGDAMMNKTANAAIRIRRRSTTQTCCTKCTTIHNNNNNNVMVCFSVVARTGIELARTQYYVACDGGTRNFLHSRNLSIMYTRYIKLVTRVCNRATTR